MADGEQLKKYGVPIYGAAWVPSGAITYAPEPKPEEDGDSMAPADKLPSLAADNYIVLAGGGGEGRSGVPNAILLVQFNPDSHILSNQPVARLGTGTDVPYRMAVHPGGEGLICSLPKSCRLFEWDASNITDEGALALKSSDRVLKHLEDIEMQLALTFNNEGSLLAVGGEDGKLRVFKWPSMEIIIDEPKDRSSVKDLDFSPDGKFLVSLGSGCCRVWDVSTLTLVASLQKKNDEMFGFCRFSQSSKNQTIYVTASHGKGGSIVVWNTTTWKRMNSKLVVSLPISAFDVSADGKLLAIGTTQGEVRVLSSENMRVLMTVKKAHMGIPTKVTFSKDSRALLSASMDSSARVTLIRDNDNENSGFSFWMVVFVILLAIAVYYAKQEGKLSWQHNFPFKF
ncbi:unnamed protein product [Cuscuta epithymum]|uniref:Anaphase-promoting complex subunit 4-like WD40 domain-containing protein n=1 Tax=Cuscuta epithymum TaxID=186058 RepID=A0AAV0BYX6_9ASTE|nr:unnamed protein product [Cuscuta epithymum]